MCKHEEYLTASRNAVVAIRASLRGKTVSPAINHELNEELSRLENYYDFDRFVDSENNCIPCREETVIDEAAKIKVTYVAKQELLKSIRPTFWYWRNYISDNAETWGR